MTVEVINSPEIDKKHSINKHLEILVRKNMNIFAREHSEEAAVHTALANEADKYGPAGSGLEDERLITPELLKAMLSHKPVIINSFLYL